jgi:crotonobetaine/carnitine-CoA ligase
MSTEVRPTDGPEPLRLLVGEDRSTVTDVLLARASASPDSPFVIEGDSTYTYGDVVTRSRQFAALARSAGLEPGGRLASYLGNRSECFWSWFGTYAAGATYVPLNRGHHGAVLADMLSRSGAKLLVVEDTSVESLPPASETGIERLVVIGEPDEGGARALGYETLAFAESESLEEAPIERVHPSFTANLMYTSGTTGRSKAVLVPHNQFCRGGARVVDIAQYVPTDVVHGWAPLFHLGAQQDGVVPTILTGSRYALFPTFSLSSFWEEVRASGATIFGGFSVIIELLWSQPPSEEDAATSLRLGLIGLIPPRIHRDFEQRFGVRLLEVYGLTEAEPLAIPRPSDNTPVGSCGRPTPDFEVTVVDSHDVPMPAGQHGEIVARPRVADVMMRGYEDDDAATLAAFRNLWFHTGDLGYFDADGYLFYVDRVKHSIRRRGENVSSWEVEAAIRQHPAVADVVVVAVPSPLGEDDIKACIVLSDGAGSVTEAELHTFCRERMARFMVPRYIALLSELPYTETGKARKDDLTTVEGIWDAEA